MNSGMGFGRRLARVSRDKARDPRASHYSDKQQRQHRQERAATTWADRTRRLAKRVLGWFRWNIPFPVSRVRSEATEYRRGPGHAPALRRLCAIAQGTIRIQNGLDSSLS